MKDSQKTVNRFVELAEEAGLMKELPGFIRAMVVRVKVLHEKAYSEFESLSMLWKQAKKETEE